MQNLTDMSYSNMLVFSMQVFNLDFFADRLPLRINLAISFGKVKVAIVYS